MIGEVFPDLLSNFSDEVWISQRAILANRNERLNRLNGCIGSSVHGTFQKYLSADSDREAEINELNYPIELLE